MNSLFWSGKKVFLTGHTGFKGSWLSLWLQKLGAEVTGYSLDPPTKPSLFEIANVADSMFSIKGNILDANNLHRTIKKVKPEIVIHMAAQSLVENSYLEPIETYSTNIMGTVHVLEAIRKTSSVKSVIIVTSDKCYENKEWDWAYRENEPLGGYDPYSSSKACAELISSAYRSSYFNKETYIKHGVSIATVRAGNVIGGGDWAINRLVPDIINSFVHGHDLQIRNPEAIRPWQHVLEPLRGYLNLAEQLFTNGPDYAEAWNFGPNESDVKQVKWIAANMAEMWGQDAQIIKQKTNGFHEAKYLKLDNSKARASLNWKPILEIKDSLKLTIDWYKQLLQGIDAIDITMRQIIEYEKRAL